MFEFLIRRTDGEWFTLDHRRLAEILKPHSVPSNQVRGWGNHRIRIPNGEISFSDEDPGWLICFEEFSGSREEAFRLVGEILANIEEATGEHGRIVEL